MLEVELRTFINKNKYEELLKFFKDKNLRITEEKQITCYFEGDKDFRLMLTDEYCQLWLKDGELHDDAREEQIVKVDNIYKDSLIKMLYKLGYEEEIKWYRVRNSLVWDGIYVTIDYTHGYGYILEVEIQVENDEDIENAKAKLQELFKALNVELTEKSEFKDKFEDYKKNWREYTKDASTNFLTKAVR
ncbi:MAG: hypothetical protein A2Y24_06285 [Clostridiales bacterium GWE2_32_10]|nr:MAG: hypothetical protein A2Y24_06285 [Clostridiales bacterium GWE2_32_10]HBY19615.1 hypothetical protein [Clostridiales bacterium]